MSAAVASARCSQLSRTSNSWQVDKDSTMVRTNGVPGSLPNAQHIGDRLGHACGIDERGELDQPDSVAKGVHELSPNTQRQARLARAAGAGERHQSALALEQGISDIRYVLIAPDQRGAFGGQIVPGDCPPAAALPSSSHLVSELYIALRLVVGCLGDALPRSDALESLQGELHQCGISDPGVTALPARHGVAGDAQLSPQLGLRQAERPSPSTQLSRCHATLYRFQHRGIR